jgi:hypothetical protein
MLNQPADSLPVWTDIVERFQLLVSLVLLFFYNISKHHINSFWVRPIQLDGSMSGRTLLSLFVCRGRTRTG